MPSLFTLSDCKIQRDRGRRSKLTSLYVNVHNVCKRVVAEPSVLAVCKQDEARDLCSPIRMTRKRTLSHVTSLFGTLRLVLVNLRKKSHELKQHQELVWMEQHDNTVATSACASVRDFVAQVPLSSFSFDILNETKANTVVGRANVRACWIKFGGKRRQCVLFVDRVFL